MPTDRPTAMTAVLLTGFGGPERLQLRHDVPVPEPGAGEVLVRVVASSVNNTDINTRIGWYAAEPGRPDADAGPGWSGDAPTFPRIQGADACGRIVTVGSGVDAARLGERVLLEPVIRAPRAPFSSARYLGSELDGGFAQFCVVPARHAHRIESALSDVELATFPCSGSTAANLAHRAGVRSGERVLVTGASGGVGSNVVQLARAAGADVIAVASASKRRTVEELGATSVIDRSDDLVAAVGARSVDVVIDLVGGPAWPALLDVLRPDGRYATSGAIGGPLVTLDLRTLYLNDLRLIGATVLDDGVFSGLVRSIEAGVLRPVVSEVFPLDRLVAAQDRFLAKTHTGKIAIEIP